MVPQLHAVHSQPEVLVASMDMAGMTHGEEARVNVRNVSIREHPPAATGAIAQKEDGSDGTVFFCEIRPLEIREVVQEGDGGRLPEMVSLRGVFPSAGRFDVINARLSSNGRVVLKFDEKTRLERIPERLACEV